MATITKEVDVDMDASEIVDAINCMRGSAGREFLREFFEYLEDNMVPDVNLLESIVISPRESMSIRDLFTKMGRAVGMVESVESNS